MIKNLSSEEKNALRTFLVDNMLFLDPYFNALQSLQAEAGVVLPEGAPTTASNLLETYCGVGIPLQVWMGQMTFTTYTRTGELHARVYTANYVEHARNFGNELRGFLKRWLHANRQIRDVFQIGSSKEQNPGGIADATKELSE